MEVPDIDLIEGMGDFRARPEDVRDVRGSIRILRLTSTRRPKCCRKSAPIIGLETCAIINCHLKSRRKPRLSDSNLVPKVLILDPLAAERISLLGILCLL